MDHLSVSRALYLLFLYTFSLGSLFFTSIDFIWNQLQSCILHTTKVINPTTLYYYVHLFTHFTYLLRITMQIGTHFNRPGHDVTDMIQVPIGSTVRQLTANHFFGKLSPNYVLFRCFGSNMMRLVKGTCKAKKMLIFLRSLLQMTLTNLRACSLSFLEHRQILQFLENGRNVLKLHQNPHLQTDNHLFDKSRLRNVISLFFTCTSHYFLQYCKDKEFHWFFGSRRGTKHLCVSC